LTVMSGKVGLITGGGQGIGLGIAHAFAAAGANLVITGRTGAKLAAAAAELSASGAKVATVCGDIAARGNAVEAVSCAMERFGRVDVLVNNAHVGIINRTIEELTDEDVETSLAGLKGTLYFMQSVIPVMKAQGAGKIINFVSRRGLQCMAGAGAYAASKEGIRALSRVAARELGAFNIQVNCISPAATSPAAEKFAAENPDRANAIRAEMALGRLGDPQRDIGRVALFLATEMSDYVTGQTISADGGIVML
jgi:NAD(P)-dependent dehydrogenase (short-subunit alcohol dehydrogenase family)